MIYVFSYRCKGLILLETYTTNKAEDFEVPPFLEVKHEVTGDLDYSMYNISKKLDPEPSLISAAHDDPTEGKSETDVEENTASEIETKVYDGVPSTSTSSVLGSTKDGRLKRRTASEPTMKVVDALLNGKKNGYHFDIARDQLTTLARSKLDICHSSAVINDMLSEDGHIFLSNVADYQRFAQLCRSGKSGAAVK